jgi:hypothetical protein
MNTILEFNENKQIFHYNTGGNLENSNGYKTLMYCHSLIEAHLFFDFLHVQFLERNIHLSFDEARITINNLQRFILAAKDCNIPKEEE